MEAIAPGSIQDKWTSQLEPSVVWLELLGANRDAIPPYGSPARDVFLNDYYRQEPILAGAVYSILSRVGGWNWVLTGASEMVTRFHSILIEADVMGWTFFIEKFTHDLLVLDRGAFAEIGRDEDGNVAGLYHLDALRCRLTGDYAYPVAWRNSKGEWVKLPRTHVAHQALCPSSRDDQMGLGFSPVSRVIELARNMVLVNQCDRERLRDAPPIGIATTNLNRQQLIEAVQLWKARQEATGNASWPGLLWLTPPGTGIGEKVEVEFVPFSQLPEQFDRKLATEIYVKTIALSFGVDVSEFWQVEHSGATKAAVTIQHQKALGKGLSDIGTGIERLININVLPPGVVFAFDKRSDEEDQLRADLYSQVTRWVTRIFDAGIISAEEARRLLADAGVIPTDMAVGTELVATDVEKVMRAVAVARGEPIISIDRNGRVLNIWKPQRFWPASKQMGLGLEQEVSAPPTLEREIENIPDWRADDIDAWADELSDLVEDLTEEKIEQWLEQGGELELE
jgi:hypothetical protein